MRPPLTLPAGVGDIEHVERIRAEDLLDSIFKVATELVRGERTSLMLRDDASADFVIARAVGLADSVRRKVRVREGEGIVGRVAASKRSILVRERADGPVPEHDRKYRTESFMSVPILIDDVLRGVINVADPIGGLPFEETDLSTLEVLAAHIGACLVQKEQDEALQRLAETDPLTWLFNRRHFDKRLEAEANRAMRAEHLLALLMIDVDRFKAINDRHGHRVGDQVLRSVASALKQAVRLYDVPTRYGGDEFAILLPEADTEAASRVGRRILEKLSSIALPEELAKNNEVLSLSIGIATFPRPSMDAAALVEAADTAMYRAKYAGGGLRVWEHALADGPRGTNRATTREAMQPAPYLADPSRLATAELQTNIPRGLASEWNAVVVGKEGHVLTVAMPHPNSAAVDALSKVSGFAIYPVYSNALDLEATRLRLSTVQH
ncbi:MAG: diguanylate cyclase [Chloroflexi bacterium]|nr:diguanylate cyclase [Chloroflexota bacterium]